MNSFVEKYGSNVLLGPNVALYTAGHPIHPLSRNSGYEYGIGISIGDNVRLGGAVVNPGVQISVKSLKKNRMGLYPNPALGERRGPVQQVGQREK